MQGSAKAGGEGSRRHHDRGPAFPPLRRRCHPRGLASPFCLRRGGVFLEKGRKPRGPDARRPPLPSPGSSGKLRQHILNGERALGPLPSARKQPLRPELGRGEEEIKLQALHLVLET